VRYLVNRPAGDLGPAELEQVARELAARTGAKLRVTTGEKLTEGYPLIAAVGRAASDDRAPRLIELEWGKQGDPRIAIVGKGVCFDSGGLDLKTGSGMRIMKKDMGGGAHALALARLIMTEKLPVRLHLLIAAVENAVSGSAYRPGDVIKSRRGLSVEVDNTDAEGRLVLADALAKAAEETPELIVDFATLTGAARVALGPDLPATFANRDDLLADLEKAASEVDDPIWRMPLWDPYDENLKSDVADLANMKLRVPNNQTYNDIAKAWGTIATTVPWPETYLALSQGVVDGIETAPGPSYDQKHYEVAKYLVRTDHLIYFHLWVVSDKSYQSWSPPLRNAVMNAAQEAALMNRKLRLEQERGVYEEFARKGVTIVQPNRDEFAAKLRPVQDAVKPELLPLLQRIRSA